MKSDLLKLSICAALLGVFFGFNVVSAQKPAKDVIVNSYSATITWVTDKPSTSQVKYGEGPAYTNETTENLTLTTFHKVTLYNLTPSTPYHYQVKSKDSFGNEAVSGDFIFTTLTEPPKDQPPQISNVESAAMVTANKPQPQQASLPSAPVAPTPALPRDTGSKLVKTEEPIEKALMQKGGILLRKGKWQIEPTTTYVHTSANRISIAGYTILPVLVIGEISTQEVKKDIFIETLTTRYGLRNDLQLEVSIPYRYQYDRVSIEAPVSEVTRHYSGLGDISTGIFYQCAYEKGAMPDLIAGISVKSRTGKEPYGRDIGLGTGHYGIKANVVAVKSSDPAILFASLGYTYNVARSNIPDYGDIKPGNTLDYSLGAAFALNYQVAISLQLQQSITERMRLNNNPVTGSFTNSASFKYGFTWSVNKNLACEVSAAHGLTTDSPDFVLEVSFPYTF